MPDSFSTSTSSTSTATTTGTPRKPLSRYRREAGVPLPGLVLQERDVALLQDLWHYRWLTTGQLELLRGSDPDPGHRFVSRLTLTRRLKLLFHHRYVQRIARPLAKGSLEPVYILDGEGAKALRRRHGEIDGRRVAARSPSQQPKPAALEHLLAVNQFRVSLTVACRERASRGSTRAEDSSQDVPALVRLLNWKSSDEVKFAIQRTERGERTRTVTLIPDGFFTLRSRGQRQFFFLEVDLGSEPKKTLVDKCRSYYAYWQGGGFADDFSLPQQVGFRVLFVAPSAKRRETIEAAVRSLAVGRSLFLTTEERHVAPEYLLGPCFRDGATEEWVSVT
jgi:hypothetical protein